MENDKTGSNGRGNVGRGVQERQRNNMINGYKKSIITRNSDTGELITTAEVIFNESAK